MQRVNSLDYLRGIMAISVMFYHYLSWSVFQPAMGGEYVLGKLGIYAVSIFFVLSGLSLALVYDGRIKSKTDVLAFYLKRAFRLFPLFWLATTAAILYEIIKLFLNNGSFEPLIYSAILNYSLLFGFIDHDNYVATGAWSIGNEVVYYSIFPIIFLAVSRFKFFLPIAFFLSLIVASYFAFFLLDSGQPLSGNQGDLYIHPFNNLFLFMGGVVIGKYFKPGCMPKLYSYSILIVSIFVFWAVPAVGDKIELISGIKRFLMSASCFGIVISVFLINPEIKGALAKALGFFGESCYSIYLLHPIVSDFLIPIGRAMSASEILVYTICVPVTLICSWISFKFIESPGIKFSKKISQTLYADKPVPSSGNASS